MNAKTASAVALLCMGSLAVAQPAPHKKHPAARHEPAPSPSASAAPVDDERSAGGMLTRASYLSRAGDLEVSLTAGWLLASSPVYPSLPLLATLGARYAITERVEAQLVLFSDTRIGVRGALLTDGPLSIGADLHYRGEIYPSGAFGAPGLGAAFFGLIPYANLGEARGAELEINGLYRLLDGMLDVFVTPDLRVMTNRTGVGAELGVDLNLGELTVGYSGSVLVNVLDYGSFVQRLEHRHGLGLKYRLGRDLAVFGHYVFVGADTYGNTGHAVSVGVAYRLGL